MPLNRLGTKTRRAVGSWGQLFVRFRPAPNRDSGWRMQDLTGQTLVITGAGSGIGAGLARYGALAGARLVLADIDDDGLAETAATILEHGTDCLAWRTDVSRAEDVQALADEAFAAFGRVDMLFNNAGVLVDGICWERTLDDWRWSLEVNLMGCIHGIKAFVPRMVEQDTEGAIVNTSSVAGVLAGGFLGPYTVSKHAVFALTEVLYNDLRARTTKLHAAVLCPGAVATQICDSERGRPTDRGERKDFATASEENFHEAISRTISDGMSPDELAGIVFAALAERRFHIFPEGEFLDRASDRFSRIVAQENPASTQIRPG